MDTAEKKYYAGVKVYDIPSLNYKCVEEFDYDGFIKHTEDIVFADAIADVLISHDRRLEADIQKQRMAKIAKEVADSGSEIEDLIRKIFNKKKK